MDGTGVVACEIVSDSSLAPLQGCPVRNFLTIAFNADAYSRFEVLHLDESSLDWKDVKTIAVEGRLVFTLENGQERIYEFETDEQLTTALRAWAARSGGAVRMVE